MGLFCSPSDPSVRHWDRLFDSSPIKGEGELVGCFVLLSAQPLTSGLRIKSAMMGRCYASFYGYCLKASMTGRPDPPLWFPRLRGNDVALPRSVDTALKSV